MKGAFMRELVAYVICAIVVLYGIRESIGTAFEERTLKYSLYKVLYYFSILLTFFLVIVNLNLVMTIIIRFKLQYLTFIYNTKYTNSIILIIFFCISQNIIYVLLKLLSQPVLSSFKSSEKRAIPLCIISGFLGFIKGLVIILIAFVGVITYNRTIGDNNKIDLFNDFLAYDRIKTIIFTETSFKNDMHPVNDNTISTANNIIYYNGVTLEEGIQSNEEIDNKAKEIVIDTNFVQRGRLSPSDMSRSIIEKIKLLKAQNTENVINKIAEAYNIKMTSVYMWRKLANLIEPFSQMLNEKKVTLENAYKLANYSHEDQFKIYDATTDVINNHAITRISKAMTAEEAIEAIKSDSQIKVKHTRFTYTSDKIRNKSDVPKLVFVDPEKEAEFYKLIEASGFAYVVSE